MAAHQEEIVVPTHGKGTYEISEALRRAIVSANVRTGLCNAFLHHTSASLIISENADPTVQSDLESFFARLVPDDDSIYRHTAEGPDDMPAHVRSVLTATSLSVPIVDGRAALGTWQGLYVYEHRRAPHRRRVTFTII